MNDTKTPGDKTLHPAPGKTLTLKRPVEQGTVRQSFSHGRSKAVVVEKVKRRTFAPGEAAPSAAPAPTPAPAPAAARPAAPSAPAAPATPRPAAPTQPAAPVTARAPEPVAPPPAPQAPVAPEAAPAAPAPVTAKAPAEAPAPAPAPAAPAEAPAPKVEAPAPAAPVVEAPAAPAPAPAAAPVAAAPAAAKPAPTASTPPRASAPAASQSRPMDNRTTSSGASSRPAGSSSSGPARTASGGASRPGAGQGQQRPGQGNNRPGQGGPNADRRSGGPGGRPGTQRPGGSGVVLRTLTEEERNARANALADARVRAVEEQRMAEERRVAEEEARRRAERERAERAEREAAEARKREEESRRALEDESKRKAEQEARKRFGEEQGASRGTSATPAARPLTPRPAAATTPTEGGEDEERRPARRGATPPRPAAPVKLPKSPGSEKSRGRLTLTNALSSEEERQRSVASFRRRTQRMTGHRAMESKEKISREVILPETITIQELANRMSERAVDVIRMLMKQGQMVKITDVIDADTAELIAEDLGHTVRRVSESDVEEGLFDVADAPEKLQPRPPVVTIMGHVDHGKTSLLDAIRKANVVSGEAGGITQHIGAYQVTSPLGGKITFIDTPGHAAFTAMRARGAKVTDIVVLVVAADDGVRPQTLEAISHARAAEVPIVVAINKIDKEGASPDRVKQELSEQNLLAEEWGGDVVMVPVSAIKGDNIDKLLEMILLVTEVEDLQANPERMARGTVIEAHLDKAKGPVATLLVQNGTLRTGDVVAAGPVLGKVRAMVDDSGHRMKEAGPSYAVEALGFSEVPTAGDEFEVYADEKSARAVVGDRASDARATRLAQQMASRRVSLTAMSGQATEGELKELNLILKADVQGSVEAILGSLEQLPKAEVQVRVLLSAPGEVTETDVDLAAASGAVIVGFNTSMASGAKKAADASGVDVRDYDVIYKLLEDIQLAMEGLLDPELVEEELGEAEVRAVFTIGKSAVAGCYVTNGKLQRNCKVRVHRGKEIVFEGDLDSLRRNKDDVKEVATGFECGIGCDRFANWEDGDRISAFKMVTQRRKLST